MDDLKDNAWSGCSCLIIGGGPSVAIPPDAHDFIIGINVAAMALDVYVDVTIAADRLLLQKILTDPQVLALEVLSEHLIHVITDQRYRAPEPWQNVRGLLGRQWSRSLNDGIGFASNTGWSAINLAVLLGCSEITLTGFDGAAVDRRTHCHDIYDEAGVKRPPDHALKTFAADTQAAILHAEQDGCAVTHYP